jgi:hypothetical protein
LFVIVLLFNRLPWINRLGLYVNFKPNNWIWGNVTSSNCMFFVTISA